MDLLNQKFDLVLGDDCMALYRDGELVCSAVKLTFYDIIEATHASCDISEADLEVYNSPEKFPPLLKDVILDPVEVPHGAAMRHEPASRIPD